MVWLTRIYQILVISVTFFMFTGYTMSAQPLFTLQIDPDQRELTIGAEPEEIWIQAQLEEKDIQLTWKLDGPGTFEKIGLGGIYTVPESIANSSVYATITAVATDNEGKASTESIVFTLTAHSSSSPPDPTATAAAMPTPTLPPTPIPTITPSPIPTATPTLTPTSMPTTKPTATVTATPRPEPKSREDVVIEEHLKNAERYFQRKMYTTPAGRNAFEEYKAVLAIDPTNRLAKEGLSNILRKYNVWGNNEYARGNYRRAEIAYQRYQNVVEYFLTVFDEKDIQQELRNIQDRLEYRSTPTPVPTPTFAPTATPSPTPTITPTPIPCRELSSRFSVLFDNVKSARRKYAALTDYGDEAVCKQVASVLSNIIGESQQIRNILDAQMTSGKCFTQKQTFSLEGRIAQIERLIQKRSQEYLQLDEQCQSVPFNKLDQRDKHLQTIPSCEELERLLDLRFENLKQDLRIYRQLCDPKISSLTNFLEHLRAIQHILQFIVPGECFTSEDVQKIQTWFPRIEEEILQYEQELSALKEQCHS